ncbi:MAG TPA: CDGSH iron-sulfur domain-containing protein [Phototrophicaceae bacterium]|jgi:CDGSH-type Zn-finger protein/uncharacterized Fe-S cluster protein YjdI|nr:CDGSH iron-sulfur domain-containing protein [Phototrophicaceae bacterium]
MTDKIHEYHTEGITVQYNLKRCIHAEACVSRLRQVFDPDKRPWIQPEHASADQIAEAISYCPSGALHSARHDEDAAEAIPMENRVSIQANGPLYLRGDLDLMLVDGDPLTETRLALCRCGASNNKPFCDNAHLDIHFEHEGVVSPEKYQISEIGTGGKLVITPTRNGSVKLEGNFEITDAAGNIVYRGTKTWVCRCGGSGNKPFCDGSHKQVGLVADGK